MSRSDCLEGKNPKKSDQVMMVYPHCTETGCFVEEPVKYVLRGGGPFLEMCRVLKSANKNIKESGNTTDRRKRTNDCDRSDA